MNNGTNNYVVLLFLTIMNNWHLTQSQLDELYSDMAEKRAEYIHGKNFIFYIEYIISGLLTLNSQNKLSHSASLLLFYANNDYPINRKRNKGDSCPVVCVQLSKLSAQLSCDPKDIGSYIRLYERGLISSFRQEFLSKLKNIDDYLEKLSDADFIKGKILVDNDVNIELWISKFTKLWQDIIESYNVITPISCICGLCPVKKSPSLKLSMSQTKNKVSNPTNFPSMRKHQKEALAKLLSIGNGIIKMATGTGKSRIALEFLKELFETGNIQGAIITTKSNDLLNQWYDHCTKWFEEKITLKHYRGDKTIPDFNFLIRKGTSAIIITSYYFLPDLFYELNHKFQKMALIVDEVHNLGARGNINKLNNYPAKFPYRLGMSATPIREYDQEGTKYIIDQLGNIEYNYSLEDGISDKILRKISYHPIYYEFSQEDKQREQEAFSKFNGLKANNPSVGKDILYTMLAQVRWTSENKFEPFMTFLKDMRQQKIPILKRTIIYVYSKKYGKKVQDILHEFTRSYTTFFGGDADLELKKFARGEIDVLITAKRISEGIDLEHLDNIILFYSPRNRLETIQRIGRALRKDWNQPHGIPARIVDFVRKKDINSGNFGNLEIKSVDQIRMKWLQKLSNI